MTRKHGERRTAPQREADLEKTASLYCQGVYQSQIAQAVGITQQQVSKDLQEIFRRWRESMLRNFDEAKSLELERVNQIERDAWRGWNKSQRVREKTTQQKFAAGAKPEDFDETAPKASKRGKVLVRVERVDGPGDPRFLLICLKCVSERCKILGLYAPKKIAPTDPTGRKPYIAAAKQLTDEQLRAVASLRRLADSSIETPQN